LVAAAVACDDPRREAQPQPPTTGGATAATDTATTALDGSSTAAAAAWELPMPELSYNLREGNALFQHYCATCHGPEGHGDGFNAYNLDPKPRDFGDPAFQHAHTDEDLVAVIRSGGGAAGLSTGMPPWGRTLGERQMRNLVLYLRTLATPPL
jgi:mono/diheme cytochrome c family protein